jgi:NADH:ubiquinone oxidoreductase subunit 6 (subunit J)
MEILFVLSSLVAVAGTFLLITQKHAVYALLGLLIAFAATAGIFVALDAAFIAVAQIIIYAGALAVMFLFVLMFTDTRTPGDVGLPVSVRARPDFDPNPPKVSKRRIRPEVEAFNRLMSGFVVPKPMAIFVSLALFACFTFAVVTLPDSYGEFGALPASYDGVSFSPAERDPADIEKDANLMVYGATDTVSRTIFEGFPLAFEVVSLLIFAALLGAVLLARRHLAGIPGTQDVGKEQPHA